MATSKKTSPAPKKPSANNFKKISIPKEVLTPISIIFAGVIIAVSIMLTGGYSFGQKASSATIGTQGIPQIPASPSSQTNSGYQDPFTQLAPDQVDKISNQDHLRGNASARIILIEYSDLECPYCKQFQATAKQLVDQYQGQLVWVYRHFPIDQLHPKAKKESEAAECTMEQGGHEAFWKFVDKVFEVTPSNNGLEPTQLPVIATQVGLNGTLLQTCIDSGRMASFVQSQIDSGTKIGVRGTPTSVIMDTKTNKAFLVPGGLPFEFMKTKIDSMLSEK